MKPTTIVRVLGVAATAAGAIWILFSDYIMFSPLWTHGGAYAVRNFWISSGRMTYSIRSSTGSVVYTINTVYWLSVLAAALLLAFGISTLKKTIKSRA
jgi:hypothetical protein